ncbi:MAG: hypothetical protein IJL00_02155, partial [Clostridia bacterium]|nr:hypothetical protein [Clostridia bacterium]
VSEAPGFLSLFCGLSLSFARKKEKPPSGVKLTAAVQEKGWLLLTQQTTQVELKEKPPSGVKLTLAGSGFCLAATLCRLCRRTFCVQPDDPFTQPQRRWQRGLTRRRVFMLSLYYCFCGATAPSPKGRARVSVGDLTAAG